MLLARTTEFSFKTKSNQFIFFFFFSFFFFSFFFFFFTRWSFVASGYMLSGPLTTAGIPGHCRSSRHSNPGPGSPWNSKRGRLGTVLFYCRIPYLSVTWYSNVSSRFCVEDTDFKCRMAKKKKKKRRKKKSLSAPLQRLAYTADK